MSSVNGASRRRISASDTISSSGSQTPTVYHKYYAKKGQEMNTKKGNYDARINTRPGTRDDEICTYVGRCVGVHSLLRLDSKRAWSFFLRRLFSDLLKIQGGLIRMRNERAALNIPVINRDNSSRSRFIPRRGLSLMQFMGRFAEVLPRGDGAPTRKGKKKGD